MVNLRLEGREFDQLIYLLPSYLPIWNKMNYLRYIFLVDKSDKAERMVYLGASQA